MVPSITLLSVLLLGQTTGEAPAEQRPAAGRQHARTMVVTRYGIVATSHTLASQAGAKILEMGGNAVDAAIAANATVGLMQPYVNGIGGDLFAIYYEAKTGKIYGLNSSGWSPKALTSDYLKGKGVKSKTVEPAIGVHTITVPGAVAGWDALRGRFGKLPLAKLLAPAIQYAEDGFPLSEEGSRAFFNKRLLDQPGFRATYVPEGKPYRVGDIFRNPALANSLRTVAAKGRDGYYKGAMAETMVKFLRENGGLHTAEDFAEFQPEWVEPISTTYRGWTVFELPPNGQGIAALSMLNIMERFPLKEWGHNSADTLHTMIEAKKLAYADMMAYVGDPRMGPVPVAEMLSKDLAERRAKLIDAKQAACQVYPSELNVKMSSLGRETIYLSTIDKEGNIVSLIQSNSSGYGTGFVAPGLGFSFHNRGQYFLLEDGKPNSLAGRKRPLHTIIPALMKKDDTVIGFGIMGGWNQSQAHAQFVSNVVDHGMNMQQAIEAARFTKATFEGCDVQIEDRVAEKVRTALTDRGHKLRVASGYTSSFGNGQAVMTNGKGVQMAGSDPRSDGAAIPESPVFRTVSGRR